jgi:hypothetical protein
LYEILGENLFVGFKKSQLKINIILWGNSVCGSNRIFFFLISVGLIELMQIDAILSGCGLVCLVLGVFVRLF